MSVGAVLEIVEEASNLIITVFIPMTAFKLLKEIKFEAIEQKNISISSWLLGDGSTKLDTRIVINQ